MNAATPAPVEAVPEVAARLFGPRLDLARRYAAFLCDAGVARGLIGPREPERIWSRHLVNAAAVGEVVPASTRTVVDLGSGAGLPGIPLLLARPELHVTLLDSMRRRIDFLAECRTLLGLDFAALHARAEGYTGPRADVVVARAVAPLERLLVMATHLVHPGGVLLALKGRTAAQEIDEAAATARRLGVMIEALPLQADPDATVVVARFPSGRLPRRARTEKERG